MKSKITRNETADRQTIAKSIANTLGTTISDALVFISAFEEALIVSIQHNKKVQLNDFVSITPKIEEEKKIVSPLDKKEYVIPRKRVVSVTIGKGFKQAIQKGISKEKKNAGTKK